MTSYHGGKQKIGKRLAEKILSESLSIAKERGMRIKGYCEPMCGMLGVYRHFHEMVDTETDLDLNYEAGDINKDVILLWKALQRNSRYKLPMSMSAETFEKLKRSKPSAIRGYVGHQYSFGGQFFKGFSGKYGKSFNAKKNIDKLREIAVEVKDVHFSAGSYTQYSHLKNNIIYCDPPYDSSTQYYTSRSRRSSTIKFETEKFNNWVRKMSRHNIVFVSEYNAPSDFIEILSLTSKLTGISPSEKKSTSRRRDKRRSDKLYLVA